ncbi:MAG: S41 family peptidase [Vicinamibacterales bacterium]
MVLQVFPDSPAAEAGLERGARIVEIDGESVGLLMATDRIGSAFGPSEEGVSSDIRFITRDGLEHNATMTKRAVTIPTVSLSRVYETEGRRVGYVFFRNFVRPSIEALDEAFAALAEAQVSDLVLDLRYNGGGLVQVAVHLASLIGGARTAGQPFATYHHNDRNRAFDETVRYEDPDRPLPSLNRLIAITSRASASASELVINSLRPFIPVVLVGDTTYGKPVGQYLLEFCDKVLAPVSFSLRNADDEGDYFDGLAPTCAAADDVTRELGDPDEASLAEALYYAGHDTCRTTPVSGASRAKAGAGTPRATGWQSLVNAY